jgi:hypothetical protein
MRLVILSICACAVLVVPGFSQHPDDNDKRSFDELDAILIDLDGDGKADRIKPRTYQTYDRRKKPLRKRDIRNWITFDLSTSGGRKIRSFFTYSYGTAEQGGSYWVYALTSIGDINKDGKTDLMFYSGDDTGDITMTLINLGTGFSVCSRNHSSSDACLRASVFLLLIKRAR